MRVHELITLLAMADEDSEVHVVLSDDEGVYNEIISVDADGVDAVEITVR